MFVAQKALLKVFFAFWLVPATAFASVTLLGAGDGMKASSAATVAFASFATENSGGSTGTFTGANLGVASANRVIVVVAVSRTSGTATAVSSLTIGGNSATHVPSSSGSLTSVGTSDIWYYADGGSLGTSATIVVNWTQVNNRSGIYVYDVTTTTPTPFAGNNVANNNTTSVNQVISVPTNGVGIVGVFAVQTGSTMSYTNATLDSANALAGGNNSSAGHTVITGAVSVTGTAAGVANAIIMSLASWGP